MRFEHYATKFKLLLNSIDNGVLIRIVTLLRMTRSQGDTVFIVGNGGSAATASHFCEDLITGPITNKLNATRLRAISLTDNVPAITAWGNDEGYNKIFVEQLKTLAKPQDVLICISVSGNSPNVVEAAKCAASTQMAVVALTGGDGGILGEIADIHLAISSMDFGLVEAAHDLVGHYLVEQLK